MPAIRARVKATGLTIRFESNDSLEALKARNIGLEDFEYV